MTEFYGTKQNKNKMTFKYIIVSVLGMDSALLLPPNVTHAQAIDRRALKPISAGYCDLVGDEVKVDLLRGSDSLNVTSRPEDAEIIRDTMIIMGLI